MTRKRKEKVKQWWPCLVLRWGTIIKCRNVCNLRPVSQTKQSLVDDKKKKGKS